MATATEYTYIMAIIAAESTRQAAKATAFTTYGYVAANLAVYKVAVADADVAYFTAVNTARNASDLTVGNVGDSGPYGGYIARILSE